MEVRQRGIAFFLIFVVLVLITIVVFYNEGSKEMKGESGTLEEMAINHVKYYQGVHGNGPPLETRLNGYKYEKFGDASTTGSEMASERWNASPSTNDPNSWTINYIFIINGNPYIYAWKYDGINHTVTGLDDDAKNVVQGVEFLDEQYSK